MSSAGSGGQGHPDRLQGCAPESGRSLTMPQSGRRRKTVSGNKANVILTYGANLE